MDLVELSLAAACCAFAHYNYVLTYDNKKIRKPWKKRRWWMTTIHRNRTRMSMERQLSELLKEPSDEFHKFTRMSQEDFQYLLNQVSPLITKETTQMREAVPATIRLAITLRFLASGDSYDSLHYLFRVSPQLISNIIPEVCEALNQILKNEIKMPSSAEEWLHIEKGFKEKFPRCIGSIDGKHVVLQCPPKSGSVYFNYKKQFSIVLFALVDSNCNFIFADIGTQGRISDGGVFRNSVLWHKISTETLNLPAPHPLPGSTRNIPYVFLGDSAFALSNYIMKPYPGTHDVGTPKRIFNQTLSRARVVVENAFGVLSTRFRIFKKPIALCPEKVTVITMTCILLHNFLKKSSTSSQIYTPPGTMDNYENNILVKPGSWREDIDNTCAVRDLPMVPRRLTMNAREIREEFTNYFCKI